MGEHYRDKHNTFIDKNYEPEKQEGKSFIKNLCQLSKKDMDEITKKFINDLFDDQSLFARFTKKMEMQIINSMTLIIFSNRYNKKDLFITELTNQKQTNKAGDSCYHTNFDINRDVCYNYSKKKQATFFSYPTEAYFFLKFAYSEEGKAYVSDKIDKYRENNLKMVEEAIESLEQMAKSKSDSDQKKLAELFLADVK